MLNFNENVFEITRILCVKDLILSSSTICENIEIIVFIIRNGDVVLFGLPFGHHHPVVRWLPWFDDVKKKICTITLEPNRAEWALITCIDGSLYLIPVLSLLGFKNQETSPTINWMPHDITKLDSPFENEGGFIPSAVAWFFRDGKVADDRHLTIVGSTQGHIIVFSILSANVLFATQVDGRVKTIETYNKQRQIYIIISNDIGVQWRILIEPIDDDLKQNSLVPNEDKKVNAIGLKAVPTEKDIKHWRMKFKQRNKKPIVPMPVECGKEEIICCGPQWQLAVKIQSVIETFLNVHNSCISARYPSKIVTIEDFTSQATTVHKLPEESGCITITKSLIVFTTVVSNHIKIISRQLSSCKDEMSTNSLKIDFVQESLLEEYIFDEHERILKIFCTDYSNDRCIVITNHAVYCLKLGTDPHKLVLKCLLEKDNLQLAEKISLVFNLDMQKVICEAGDVQLSLGRIKEAIQLYNLTRCGGAHLILMLAVLGHMPELLDALRSCHYGPAYKLHFMNLKLLVFLHQFLTSYSKKLHTEFRDLLLQNGYDEALAISVLTQAGLCKELLFLTSRKGLQPITLNVIMHILHHNHPVNVARFNGFWYLISDESFCDTLLIKPNFVMFHHKLVQNKLPHLSRKVLRKLEALYNPYSVSVRAWITNLIQGDVPIKIWIQTYILICTHLSAKEKQFHVDTIGKISVGQEWSFRNSKSGIYENRIGAGFSHAAVIIDGNAYSWGSTSFSCLGNGPTNGIVSGPVFIDTFFNIGVRVFAISCGRNHTLAITDNGVYSWGNNKFGQLGNSIVVQSSYPTLIKALEDCNIIQVVAGQYHCIALDDTHRVFTWGWGVHGQLGHGNIDDCYYPKLVSSLGCERIKWSAAGQAHSMFLSEDGVVWTCGSNLFGQLGTGKNKKSSIPLKLCALTEKIKMISAGYFHNFALTFMGQIFSWGCSPNLLRTAAHSAKRKMRTSGEEKKEITTLEETFDYLYPKSVDTTFIKGNIVKVVAGSEHNALLTDDGSLYTWGRNMDGQLGIKTASVTERRSQNIGVPTLISIGTEVSDIACGYDFTVALDTSGNVWTWGANHYSLSNRNALSSLEGEIVIVNNKSRVIKLPHNSNNAQPLPTLLNIPIEQKVLRKDLKPILPIILQTDNWRYRMHYTIETLEPMYSSPDFMKQCVSVGESDASAKLSQVSGDISSALRLTLKSAIEQCESATFLKSIICYYFTISFFHSDKLNEVLINVITFWNENSLPLPQLEDIFYNSWKNIAIPLGDLFFRLDSKYNSLSLKFSTKFKLKLVQYMLSHKSNNLDCIFEGCCNVKDILTALNKVNDYTDIVLDPKDCSKKKITFKGCSGSSRTDC